LHEELDGLGKERGVLAYALETGDGVCDMRFADGICGPWSLVWPVNGKLGPTLMSRWGTNRYPVLQKGGFWDEGEWFGNRIVKTGKTKDGRRVDIDLYHYPDVPEVEVEGGV
jgi:hypothetical protein